MGKRKYYAVAIGRKPGIYETWAEAEAQVKAFPNAKFKSFKTDSEAKNFIDESTPLSSSSANDCKGRKTENNQNQVEVCRNILNDEPTKRRRSMCPSERKLMILVSFDGGSRGNPGVAGAGTEVIIREMLKNIQKSRKKIHARKFVGYKMTNNVAEYHGLVCGLRHAFVSIKKIQNVHRSDVHDVDLVVQGDSDLIIQQLNGTYECRSEDLKPLYKEARSVILEIEKNSNILKTKYEHVYRCHNAVADGLANEAMDAQRSWVTFSEDS